MEELDLTVLSRRLQRQLRLHQGHVPSEEFLLTAAPMVGLGRIVKFQVGLPNDPLQLQLLVPMEAFLHIAAPMEVKARTV